jgi:cytochrome c oxidase subunit 2
MPLAEWRTMRRAALLAIGLTAAACSGPQSALDPAGEDANRAALLFTWMSVGLLVIWAAVVALAMVIRRAGALQSRRGAAGLIVGGGVALPLAVLIPLLVLGLADLPRIVAPGPAGFPSIEVTGAQWWWRVRYITEGHDDLELANEIRLPLGRRTNTQLFSSDVIHSFWVPSIAGKMDMIPGRLNHLALEPTRTGVFRGACAEFCGMSHAKMNFVVVVVPPDEFDEWLAAQRRPASPPIDPAAIRGQAAFRRHGCSTCHTIRGTPAAGVSGPDLTHVGSRQTIAAGLLPTNADELRRWITGTELLKPGTHMPVFASLPESTVSELAAYLLHLQ